MSFDNVYKNIANDVALARESMVEASEYLANTRSTVVDVTTSDYTDENEAIQIELQLLGVVNSSYVSYKDMMNSSANLTSVVKAVNNYVVNNMDETLTEYVNNIDWSTLDGRDEDLIPYEWAQLSEQAGYDISEWEAEMS